MSSSLPYPVPVEYKRLCRRTKLEEIDRLESFGPSGLEQTGVTFAVAYS